MAQWIKPAATQNKTIVRLALWVDSTATKTNGFQLEIQNNTGLYFTLGNATTSGTASAAAVLTTGAWNFVDATYDGSTIKIYVNDTLVASRAFTDGMTKGTLHNITFAIDDDNTGTDGPYKGAIAFTGVRQGYSPVSDLTYACNALKSRFSGEVCN